VRNPNLALATPILSGRIQMSLSIERWDESLGKPNEENLRQKLENEGYSVVRYDYPPGTVFPEHTHGFDKKDAVVQGTFRIRALGQEYLLGPGDALAVPAWTVHSADVIGDETVVSLDASKR
jgi:quercetin dioxygenase-like cupin family protein